MKGLFLLDAAWLKQQKRLLIILGALIILYLATEMGPFLVAFGTLFASIILQKTVLFNLSDSSASFLFTLPFSRKDFVVEKYILCLLLPAVLGALCLVLALALGYDPTEMLFTYGVSVVLTMLLGCLMIPLMIRFRENSSLYLISIGALAALLLTAVSLDSIDLSWAAGLLVWPALGWVIAAGVMILTAIVWGSAALSLYWLNRQTL